MKGIVEPQSSYNKYYRIAWGVCIANAFILIGLAIFYILNRGDILSLINTTASALLPVVGAIIITRQPRNFIGWGMIAAGWLSVGSDLCGQYATYALITHPGILPFGDLVSWVGSWSWLGPAFLTIPLVLLFPNGTLSSPRWWWVIVAGAFIAGSMTLILMAATWPLRGKPILEANNNQQVGISPGNAVLWQWLGRVQVLLILISLFAVVGLAIRFFRSRGVERQQLKWFVMACLLFPFSLALPNGSADPLLNVLIHIGNLVPIIFVQIAIAIAVTRYRLYEIDVIIRRTLVYSILTIVLALLYFSLVFLLQEGFTLVSGQKSSISIVISTLLIAILFTPLRHRIQDTIDRRFYRRKYDSEKMIRSFVSTVRNEVELERLTDHLVSVIDQTMQPEHVSLWIRKPMK